LKYLKEIEIDNFIDIKLTPKLIF